MKEVIISNAPISDRYWYRGCKGEINETTNRIRVSGCWFDFDDRWEVEDVITLRLRGKVERIIMDWCLTHGGNTDPALWRDNFGMDEVPEPAPELISSTLEDGTVNIPEPYEKWIELLLLFLEDFESLLDTEGEDWLISNTTKVERNGRIWYEEEHFTSLPYAYKVCKRLKNKLKKIQGSL